LAPPYYTDNTRTTVFRTGVVDLTSACVAWGSGGYRLPTEAEWERAARGGVGGHHFAWPSGGHDYWGHILGTLANYWNSTDPFDNGTTPVGFYNGTQAVGGVDVQNAFGLYDMSGNVAEFCWDRMGSYATLFENDPRGPDVGDQRVARGGSWYDEPDKLRLAARQAVYAHHAPPTLGLRCVRTAER
jgi:formylglycine-generating enzyme required for sulfatase activity